MAQATTASELLEALEGVLKAFPVSEFGNVKKHYHKLVALSFADKAVHKAREEEQNCIKVSDLPF